MVRLDELFDIHTGKDLIYSSLEEGTINVVGHSAINNGIVCTTTKLEGYKLYESGLITLADRGNFKAFIQPKPFYVGTRVKVLIPKVDMSLREKLYYCKCIDINSYRFNYGRVGGNKIKDILIPSKEEIPSWVYEMDLPKYEVINGRHTEEPTPSLDVEKWGSFKYSDLFDISIGKSTDLNKLEQVEDGINYVGRTDVNNGVTAKVRIGQGIDVYSGNCLTVPMVGNSLMRATYQRDGFVTSQNILILRLKGYSSILVYLFLATLIRIENYRFSYGRSLSFDRLDGLKLKLPTTKEGTPDWEFMEKYIKTLKYSKEL